MTNKIKNSKNNPEARCPELRAQGYVLYLDTSESEAVLAIYDDTKRLVEERWRADRELSKTLSPKYAELLEKSQITSDDLTGICVFVGPGSFTGLRIGISFANGLAFSLEIPIYETTQKESISLNHPKEIALPLYGAEPNITKPKQK
jgi:tRNA threonylcarbamoyladenosine biosynthesis protein TsaB